MYPYTMYTVESAGVLNAFLWCSYTHQSTSMNTILSYLFFVCVDRAFSGKYVSNKEEGVYTCVVCGNQLFSSDTKYDSKSGWPAFYDVVSKKHITVKDDMSHGKSYHSNLISLNAFMSDQSIFSCTCTKMNGKKSIKRYHKKFVFFAHIFWANIITAPK